MEVSKELYVCVVQDGSFQGFSQMRGGRPIMMKLDIVIPYQNKIQLVISRNTHINCTLRLNF